MKSLTRIFLIIFVLGFYASCEPEELNEEEIHPINVIGETGGDQEDVIDDVKKTP